MDSCLTEEGLASDGLGLLDGLASISHQEDKNTGCTIVGGGNSNLPQTSGDSRKGSNLPGHIVMEEQVTMATDPGAYGGRQKSWRSGSCVSKLGRSLGLSGLF